MGSASGARCRTPSATRTYVDSAGDRGLRAAIYSCDSVRPCPPQAVLAAIYLGLLPVWDAAEGPVARRLGKRALFCALNALERHGAATMRWSVTVSDAF